MLVVLSTGNVYQVVWLTMVASGKGPRHICQNNNLFFCFKRLKTYSLKTEFYRFKHFISGLFFLRLPIRADSIDSSMLKGKACHWFAMELK